MDYWVEMTWPSGALARRKYRTKSGALKYAAKQYTIMPKGSTITVSYSAYKSAGVINYWIV